MTSKDNEEFNKLLEEGKISVFRGTSDTEVLLEAFEAYGVKETIAMCKGMFAIALLDRYDNGVVLNGLYGSESSNIYAKPIKNGKSETYQLSEEEKYAIEIAEQNKNFYAKHRN